MLEMPMTTAPGFLDCGPASCSAETRGDMYENFPGMHAHGILNCIDLGDEQ
jgi:hypothetical protein